MLRELSVAGVSPNTLPSNYVIVCKTDPLIGVIGVQNWLCRISDDGPRLCGTDEPSLQQIDLRPAVHLAFHELQSRHLALRLAVGP